MTTGSNDSASTMPGATGWAAMHVDARPAAPDIGPFPFGPFLAAVEDAVATPMSEVEVVASDTSSVALVGGDAVRFAGPAHLTDYHAPLGPDGSLVATALARFPGHRFSLDSLPTEAADAVVAALTTAGMEHELEEDESTAVLTLPATYEEWLASIGKKERHEVRRKRRRFEDTFGRICVERCGVEDVPAFAAMHRTSPGEKGSFMTPEMERLFTRLVDEADACLHALVCGGSVRAWAFGFESPTGYWYYNSAYDPDAAMASPGVVLLSSMIEDQIGRGARVFDFLKGDERYKYRHGATKRPLFTVSGTVP